MRTNLRLVLGLAAALSIGACDTTRIFRGDPDDVSSSSSDWVTSTTPLKGTDLESLWDATDHVLRMEGYQVDSTRTRYDTREMVTHWDANLAPNRFEGTRHRAVVKFVPESGGEWSVSVLVQMQRNIDINNPSSAPMANWEPRAGDTARANVLLYRIETGFRNPEDDLKKPTQ